MELSQRQMGYGLFWAAAGTCLFLIAIGAGITHHKPMAALAWIGDQIGSLVPVIVGVTYLAGLFAALCAGVVAGASVSTLLSANDFSIWLSKTAGAATGLYTALTLGIVFDIAFMDSGLGRIIHAHLSYH
jgi:hypothetical protein